MEVNNKKIMLSCLLRHSRIDGRKIHRRHQKNAFKPASEDTIFRHMKPGKEPGDMSGPPSALYQVAIKEV